MYLFHLPVSREVARDGENAPGRTDGRRDSTARDVPSPPCTASECWGGRPTEQVARSCRACVVGDLAVKDRATITRRGYVQISKSFHRFRQARKAVEIEAEFGVRLVCPAEPADVENARWTVDLPGCGSAERDDASSGGRLGEAMAAAWGAAVPADVHRQVPGAIPARGDGSRELAPSLRVVSCCPHRGGRS